VGAVTDEPDERLAKRRARLAKVLPLCLDGLETVLKFLCGAAEGGYRLLPAIFGYRPSAIGYRLLSRYRYSAAGQGAAAVPGRPGDRPQVSLRRGRWWVRGPSAIVGHCRRSLIASNLSLDIWSFSKGRCRQGMKMPVLI
jgi:hypothetical protein